MPRRSLKYGESRIEYDVLYTKGKRRKVSIHVHPDGSVQVDAPEGEPLSNIHDAVLKRARWVRRHVDAARRQQDQVLPRLYVSGENLFYLGRRYQLKLKSRTGPRPAVKLLRGQIVVETAKRDASTVRDLLSDWYRARAADVFLRRIDALVEHINWLDDIPDWRLVRMKKQWGSCSPSGTILLNPHLVKAPRDCVDYVICHELCHLQEHNHSPRYYRLLGQLMPGWQVFKARLDGMAELLLNE